MQEVIVLSKEGRKYVSGETLKQLIFKSDLYNSV